jgi:hypothetical protein
MQSVRTQEGEVYRRNRRELSTPDFRTRHQEEVMSRFAARFGTFIFATTLTLIFALSAVATAQQETEKSDQDRNLDIRSSLGDLHVGKDADARSAGLPLYPGGRLRRDEENSDALNLGILTQAFGMKLVVAKYDSNDAPGKVVDFYREKLKKYGKVVECHTSQHGGDVHTDVDDRKNHSSKELKCEGDNTGAVTELKVGTDDNQHIVAIEPSGKGSTFALVYLYTRGKQDDI